MLTIRMYDTTRLGCVVPVCMYIGRGTDRERSKLVPSHKQPEQLYRLSGRMPGSQKPQ